MGLKKVQTNNFRSLKKKAQHFVLSSVIDEYLKYSFYPYAFVSFSSVFMLNKFPNA